jgi:ParB family transcriptional regulator, chromosome partitioning protein
MTKQALGRGFDSLIPANFALDDVAAPGEHIKNIEIEKIIPNPDQPRKSFDETSLKELSKSIKQHGVIQPIVVTPYKDKYRIVAGERRHRASKIAGLKKIPTIVRNHEELEELEISLVENVQRVDLSPIEQAVSIVRLHDQFSMSYSDIAKKLGKAETTISNIVRLLQLPEPALKALQENKISEGHARAILALKTDEKLQKELLNKIITQGITVRQAEALHKPPKVFNEQKLEKNLLILNMYYL